MSFGRAAVKLGCCAACLVAGLLNAPEVGAWEAVTGPPDLPVIAVDKAKQRLFLVEGGTVRPFVCTTGQREGDKQVRGDLKTPEGVYFVLRKRTDRLDFEDYGGEAYILDYPNPVDRLRGKTGSGIWVHSRGHAVTPRESRGCVVLNLKDIAVVGPKLRPGTPVVIGETAKAAAHPVESEAVRQVERRTRDWCEAWERQAPLDALYAPENDFARRSLETDRSAQRRFAKRGGKPRFGTVRALEGPGYWVSWYTQRAPDGTWSGIRRLYWQRIGDGFLIVGEEGGA